MKEIKIIFRLGKPTVIAVLFASVFYGIGCSYEKPLNSNKNKNDIATGKTMGYYTLDGDSVIIPPFEIEVNLSKAADQIIKNRHETIIVAAYFSGRLKSQYSKTSTKDGEFDIATSERELRNTRIAKFSGIKLSKSLLDSLEDKDISLLINVVSGRKSSKDNWLDCGILQDKISAVRGRKFTIDGKLIYQNEHKL